MSLAYVSKSQGFSTLHQLYDNKENKILDVGVIHPLKQPTGWRFAVAALSRVGASESQARGQTPKQDPLLRCNVSSIGSRGMQGIQPVSPTELTKINSPRPTPRLHCRLKTVALPPTRCPESTRDVAHSARSCCWGGVYSLLVFVVLRNVEEGYLVA